MMLMVVVAMVMMLMVVVAMLVMLNLIVQGAGCNGVGPA